jgi:hypothetical protein
MTSHGRVHSQPAFAAVMYVQHALKESRAPKIVSIAWRMMRSRSPTASSEGYCPSMRFVPPTHPSTDSWYAVMSSNHSLTLATIVAWLTSVTVRPLRVKASV